MKRREAERTGADEKRAAPKARNGVIGIDAQSPLGKALTPCSRQHDYRQD
jgi:hypothetical protein